MMRRHRPSSSSFPPQRQRCGQEGRQSLPLSESSSDEEDAFAAMSKRRSKKDSTKQPTKTSLSQQEQKKQDENKNEKTTAKTIVLPASTTSSMKRHHLTTNESRKAKMDALLLELEAEKQFHSNHPNSNRNSNGGSNNSGFDDHQNNKKGGFVPDKKGSFVDPGEEHLTTNIFVANLAPSITEEQLTDLFRQFGELYSVKIMWPRTPEERARNRNTGFVCFMNRVDAEIAMEECSEKDPFHVGRRLMMRWGKNVKKTIKRGTGGVMQVKKSRMSISATQNETIQKKDDDDKNDLKNVSPAIESSKLQHENMEQQTNDKNLENKAKSNGNAIKQATEKHLVYDPNIHGKDAINVLVPSNPLRMRFITTIASFVAKDGSIFERKLMDIEAHNSNFDFLMITRTSMARKQQLSLLQNQPHQFQNTIITDTTNERDSLLLQEHIYYKWRVYSFCQGDGINAWRTKPFQMLHPNGNFWIPPNIIDIEAARKEEEDNRIREDSIRQKQQRRRTQRNMMSAVNSNNASRKNQDGRKKNAKDLDASENGDTTGSESLIIEELQELNMLIYKKLNMSRASICEAMSYCFEKSFAAKQISNIIRQAIIETSQEAALSSSSSTNSKKKKNSINISVDTRIARLYLLSDVLFNSQQPGIRNAFLYRNEIEKMSPDIFRFLGRYYCIGSNNKVISTGEGDAGDITSVDHSHPHERLGRLTLNKLKTAVGAILSAWTNWSVYNPMFLDDLEAYFEGREVKKEDTTNTKQSATINDDDDANKVEDELAQSVKIITSDKQRRGDWTEVTNEEDAKDEDESDNEENLSSHQVNDGANTSDSNFVENNEHKNSQSTKEDTKIASTDEGMDKIALFKKDNVENRDGIISQGISKNDEDCNYNDGSDIIKRLIDTNLDGDSLLSEDEIYWYEEELSSIKVNDSLYCTNIDNEDIIAADETQLFDEDIDGEPLTEN